MKSSIHSISRLPIAMAFVSIVLSPAMAPSPTMRIIPGTSSRSGKRKFQNQFGFKNQFKINTGLKNRTQHK